MKLNKNHGKAGRMGAAIATNSTSFYRTWSSGAEMHVVGRDLVRPVPQNLVSRGSIGELFSVIPANPAYWTGTRVAQLAPGYMQYRPLDFIWEYIPQVAVTQSGTVTMGTLWDTSVNDQDLQQTLVTSNGGCITQCYNSATRSISLGSNLQYNLYQLTGYLSAQTNPFTFVAAAQGTNGITPGYFMITYHYVFKNPIGSSWDFATDWNTTLGTSYKYDYVSAIPMKEDQGLDPAEILHFKDGVWLFEDDTPVPPANYEAIPVALFACTPSATVRTIQSGVETPYTTTQTRLVAFSMAGEWIVGTGVEYTLYTGPIAVSTTTDNRAYYTGVIVVTGNQITGHNYWGRFHSGNISITLDFPDADAIYYYIVGGTNAATNEMVQVVDSGATSKVYQRTLMEAGSQTVTYGLNMGLDVLPLPGTIPTAAAASATLNRLLHRMAALSLSHQ